MSEVDFPCEISSEKKNDFEDFKFQRIFGEKALQLRGFQSIGFLFKILSQSHVCFKLNFVIGLNSVAGFLGEQKG